MTWAARYSATDEPELTIYRDGVEHSRVAVECAGYALTAMRGNLCLCDKGSRSWIVEIIHDRDLRADIAARVPVRECEETQACTRHAMPDGRCREHGGRDEL